MNTFKRIFTLGALIASLEPGSAGVGNSQTARYAIKNQPGPEKPTAGRQSPTYLQDVVPIVMGKCYRCHNQQTTFLSNWLDYRTAYADRAELKRRIWDSWKGAYFKQSMPIANSPESDAITDEERTVLKQWVERGALYGVPPTDINPHSKAERIEAGRKLFTTICAACHQPTGQGLPNRFPPLAGSDFLNSDKRRAIQVVINGLQGEVVVNGLKFNNIMPQLPLSDAQIAAALTYVYNSFGNSGQEVTTEEVKFLRAHNEAAGNGTDHGSRGSKASEVSPWE